MRFRLIFAILTLVLFSVPAQAQLLQPGQIGIYANAEGTLTETVYIPNQPFDLYILAYDLPGGIIAWECSVQLPDSVFLVNVEYDDAASINVGQPIPGTNDLNFIVGRGSGCNAFGGLVQLAKVTLITSESFVGNELACLAASQPASLAPPVPAYATCNDDVLPLEIGAGWNGNDGCVRIGFGLCGGLLPSRVYFQLIDTFGPPATSVTMPLEIGRAGYVDCDSADLDVNNLLIRFQWDQSVGTLSDVVPTGPIAGWTRTITPIAGGVDVRVQGPFTPFTGLQKYLDLQFDLAPSDGQTEVEMTVLQLTSFISGYYTILWQQSGTLGTPPIPTETTSVGKLKASFR